MSDVPQEMMSVNSKFSTDTFKILVDHKELVTEMFRTLTGYELKWSADGSPVLVEGEYKMMNRKGALHFFHFIRQSVNPITSLTDWDEERANRHLQNRMLNFNLSLYNNYNLWEIDASALSDISTGMCELIDASLRMAIGGKHREAITENIQRSSYKLESGKQGFPNMMPGGVKP